MGQGEAPRYQWAVWQLDAEPASWCRTMGTVSGASLYNKVRIYTYNSQQLFNYFTTHRRIVLVTSDLPLPPIIFVDTVYL